MIRATTRLPKLLIGVVLIISMLISGCGTLVLDVEEGHPVTYGGIQLDFAVVIVTSGLAAPLALLDFPLSLILDTLLLPIGLQYPGLNWRGFFGGC